MHKFLIAAAGLALMSAPVFAQQPAPAPAAVQHATLTVDSTVGQLLGNPQALAILEANIPEVVQNPQFQGATDLPLRAIAQFEPSLTDAKLKKIGEELAALGAKK